MLHQQALEDSRILESFMLLNRPFLSHESLLMRRNFGAAYEQQTLTVNAAS